jgi:hypothetical protein
VSRCPGCPGPKRGGRPCGLKETPWRILSGYLTAQTEIGIVAQNYRGLTTNDGPRPLTTQWFGGVLLWGIGLSWQRVLREAEFWRSRTIGFGANRVMTGQHLCRWQVEACRRLREAVDEWVEAGRPMPKSREKHDEEVL